MSASPTTARWASRYCEIGIALTWTAPGGKGPRHAGWNLPDNAITDPKRAFGYWLVNPDHGMAALLGPSGLVSLDIDDEQYSPRVLGHFGIDLEQLRESTPAIVGRHFRLMFKAPAAEIKHRSATWSKQGAPGNFVLFELRAGNLADTLPPTRHAVTGTPLPLENPPRNGFPPLPARLLELWLDWETTNREIRALCPWWTPPPDAPPARISTASQRRDAEGRRESVIDAFNQAHDAAAILEAHGYKRKDKRFISPDSTHAAGIVLLEAQGVLPSRGRYAPRGACARRLRCLSAPRSLG